MNRLAAHLDRIIDGGLIFLVVFTPLAFGTVETWSRAVAQVTVVVVFAAWLLKVIWGPPPLVIHLDADGQHGRASRGGLRRWRGLLGGRVVLSGLEGVAVVFALLITLQIVPLPLHWIEAMSPRTAVMAADLPPAGDPASVRGLESWLLARGASPPAGGRPGAFAAPGADVGPSILPDAALAAPPSAGRRLSLLPGETRRRLEIFLAYLAVFVIGVNHWRDRRHADRVVAAIAATGGGIAVLGILQRLTWDGRILWLREAPEGRIAWGPFVNHNHFAGYLELAVPVAVGLAALVYEQARLQKDPSARTLQLGERVVPQVLLLGAGALFGVIALLACGSRGGLLAALGAVGLFLLTAPWRRRAWWRGVAAGLAVLAVGALVAARVGGAGWWERYATLADPAGEPSFAFRLETSRRTLDMVRDFPLAGVGLGAFEPAYRAYASGERVRRAGAAHNDYVQLTAESGLIGAGLAGLALVLFAGRFLGPALVRTGSPRRHLVHGLAVGSLALLLHSAWDFNLQIYSNGLLFVMAGALLAADRIARTPREVPGK